MARKSTSEKIAAARKADASHEATRTSKQTSKLETELDQLGVRIPRDISNRLKIVATTRKVKKLEPYTQAEIVAAALRDWLKIFDH